MLFLAGEYEYRCFDVLHVLFILFAAVHFDAGTFDEGRDIEELRLGIVFQHPDIGMETLEVDVEYLLVVLDYSQELPEVDLIFYLVQLHFIKNVSGVLFYQGSNVIS